MFISHTVAAQVPSRSNQCFYTMSGSQICLSASVGFQQVSVTLLWASGSQCWAQSATLWAFVVHVNLCSILMSLVVRWLPQFTSHLQHISSFAAQVECATHQTSLLRQICKSVAQYKLYPRVEIDLLSVVVWLTSLVVMWLISSVVMWPTSSGATETKLPDICLQQLHVCSGRVVKVRIFQSNSLKMC